MDGMIAGGVIALVLVAAYIVGKWIQEGRL